MGGSHLQYQQVFSELCSGLGFIFSPGENANSLTFFSPLTQSIHVGNHGHPEVSVTEGFAVQRSCPLQ